MKQSSEMLSQCACTRARTVARLVTKIYDDLLRPIDVKASQLSVLAAVDSLEAPSIAALSKALFMDRTTLSRNLGPLVSAGLVVLAEDGRSKTISMTVKGKNTIKAAYPLWQQAQKSLRQRLGEDFVNRMQAPLRRWEPP